MPSVPRLTGPQVQEAPLRPQMRSTQAPSDFGNTRALQQINSETAELGGVMIDQANQLAVLEADRKLSELETKMLYDQNEGAFNRRGKDAFALPEQVSERWEKETAEIEKSLSNPVQRDAFYKMRQSRFQDIDRSIQKHVANEIKQYDDQETNAYIASERSAAALNYQDPERVRTSIERQQIALMRHAKANGLGNEYVTQKMKQLESATNLDVLNQFVTAGDDIKAKEFYDSRSDRFFGDDIGQAKRAVEEGSIRGESQRLSDKISSQYPNSLKAAMEATKSIENPKVRDATAERIKANWSIKEAQDRENEEIISKSGFTLIDKTPGLTPADLPTMVKGWDSLPGSVRSSLKSYLENKVSNKSVATDLQTYYDLKTLASNPKTKDAFKNENLMKYVDRFSDSDFKNMVDLQASLRKGDPKAEDQLDDWRTEDQIISTAWQGIGKNKTKDAEEFTVFANQVAARQRTMQKQMGRKLNNEEIQSIVDGLLIEGVTEKGIIWDTRKRAYELETGEVIEVEAKDIPRTERQRIEAALKRRGMPVTEETIIDMYSKKIQRMSSGN